MQGEIIETDVFQITVPSRMGETDPKDLQLKIKTWLIESAKLYILDFKETFELSLPIAAELLKFAKTLRSHDKTLVSLNISPKLLKKLEEKGLDFGFQPTSGLSEAKLKAGFKPKKTSPPKIDAEFIGIFVNAARKTLEVQASTPIQPSGKPFARKSDEPYAQDLAIAGVLNLNSKQFNGSISLCFNEKTFLKIYENMVDEKCTEIDEEIQDAAGELLNIIYGQAKTVLVNEKGYDLGPALPNILVGEKLRIRYRTNAPIIVLPFSCEAGEFHIEIVVESGAEKQKAA